MPQGCLDTSRRYFIAGRSASLPVSLISREPLLDPLPARLRCHMTETRRGGPLVSHEIPRPSLRRWALQPVCGSPSVLDEKEPTPREEQGGHTRALLVPGLPWLRRQPGDELAALSWALTPGLDGPAMQFDQAPDQRSPMPRPPRIRDRSRSACTKRPKICGNISEGMPTPVSRTVSLSHPRRARRPARWSHPDPCTGKHSRAS